LGGAARTVTKTVNDASHISNGENRRVIDGDNVGAGEFTTRAMKTVAKGRSINLGDKGTTKAGASVKGEAQWRWGLGARVKCHGHSRQHSERLCSDLQVGYIGIKVHELESGIPDAIKKMSIGRLLSKIIHSLVKSNMLSGLDSLGDGVKIEDVLHGVGVAEEDANMCIGGDLVLALRTRWECIHMAAKDMKKLEVRLLASADFKWRGSLVMVNHHIVQSEMVMEGIGPELGQEVGTSEHSMKGITNHLVRALAWSTLVR
jgi:hypothetical protein